MKCQLCNKEMKLFDTKELEKVKWQDVKGFNKIFKTDLHGYTYTCKCPVYLFDELDYIKDNKINLNISLSKSNLELLYSQFRRKKTFINVILERIKINDIDQGRNIFNQYKETNIDSGEGKKIIKNRDMIEEAQNIDKAIRYLRYRAYRNKKIDEQNGNNNK